MESDIRDKILEKVSIRDIYPKTLRNNRGHCALHENTSSPSFLYYSHDNTWCCFSCGTGGDVISLYSHIHGLSYKESIIALAEEYQIGISENDKLFYKQKDKIRDCQEFFMEICHQHFLESEYYHELKEKRGFSDNIINEYKIGLFDQTIKRKLTSNFTKSALYYAGFLNKKEKWYFGKRIVFPYLNTQKRPVYFIYRLIDEDPDFREDAKYVKQVKTDFTEELLFGVDSTIRFHDKPLIITEGITDALSVIDVGYPCLSPVTTRFKDTDIFKIINYAKRFNQIIIINDTEENKSGLKGAEKTLHILLKQGINTYISKIPNPENLEKIDLNDYIKKEKKKGLEELINNAEEGFDYLLNIMDINSEEDLKDIISIIPENKLMIKTRLIDRLNKKTKIGKRDLKALYKTIKLQEKEKLEQQQKLDIEAAFEDEKIDDILIDKGENVIDQVGFNGANIVNREDGIFIRFLEEGGVIEKQILESGITLINKTRYLDDDWFSYKFKDNYYNTQTRSIILITLRNYTYLGELGRDALKKLINHMGEKLEYKDCKITLGFDDGWILPFLEIEDDYRILVNTDLQKRVYTNTNNIYYQYTEKEKGEIKKKIERFIEITEMNRSKLAVIIGWSMASVFKLAILDYLQFFPGLLCIGDAQSGKTYTCKFYIVDFFQAWKNYLSGGSIKSESRCEDILSTSTFPIHLDELEYVKYDIIEILKSTLSGVHDYIRKINALEIISKPEVAPFCVTTNNPPRPFLDPALNSKILLLNFTAKEKIKVNNEWVRLANELGKKKLFSFLYEFTKDWTNEDIQKILEFIRERSNVFRDKSRLRLKYIVVLFGLWLFANLFDIKLFDDLDIRLFEYSERIISEDLLETFVAFCNRAISYEDNSTTSYGTFVKGNNPKYLTTKLKSNHMGDFIFTKENLRDFNEFVKEKYNMRNLGGLLNDSIQDKEIIKYGTYSLDGQSSHSIKIRSDFRKAIGRIDFDMDHLNNYIKGEKD